MLHIIVYSSAAIRMNVLIPDFVVINLMVLINYAIH